MDELLVEIDAAWRGVKAGILQPGDAVDRLRAKGVTLQHATTQQLLTILADRQLPSDLLDRVWGWQR